MVLRRRRIATERCTNRLVGEFIRVAPFPGSSFSYFSAGIVATNMFFAGLLVLRLAPSSWMLLENDEILDRVLERWRQRAAAGGSGRQLAKDSCDRGDETEGTG
jgi:hypothetical protein